MTLAEPTAAKPQSRAAGLPGRGGLGMRDLMRSPTWRIPLPNQTGALQLGTDRVRARAAVTPQISMMIGMTAIGLGAWGTFFPKSVARTFGMTAPTPLIRAAFGGRELWTGYTLAGDPTKAGMLWTRVAADVVDIAVLRALDKPSNRKRTAARVGLGFVLAVAALDLITAVRMTNVRRNCE